MSDWQGLLASLEIEDSTTVNEQENHYVGDKPHQWRIYSDGNGSQDRWLGGQAWQWCTSVQPFGRTEVAHTSGPHQQLRKSVAQSPHQSKYMILLPAMF